ncbi:gamma-glutamyltranspeptidase / glutathione hydrolase [Halogranum rubrum]|uniref:Gamma-glutamyltranspeptidase / glutathione hydrolase n=1 Tax=Halogranum rubrum TaxID=553466 RepID=A0A1I4B6R4_9EURY|nr:gamma-glutamyltransferase [Halogranum rubrum]SFK63566.1 gamma-glutamyltranspeptidase / glutathione hydrolase [Halogranum rubrum]
MSQDNKSLDADRLSGFRTDRRTFLKGSMAALGTGAVSTGAVRGQEGDGPTAGDVPTARGADGMVSSAHPQATEIGAEVLRDGGNAIDAAVAVQFALNVVQPHASGIGGGGFMVVYDADEDELYSVDNRERAPFGATPDMFLDDDGEPIPFQTRRASGDAVGVPGTLRAADVALKRFGSRELSSLIDPAVGLAAESGPEVTVDASLAEAIVGNSQVFNDAAQSVFAPGGTPLEEGATLTQPDLADTFRTIRDEGIGAFYKGPIGEAMAETVQDAGGSMRPSDVGRYNVTIDHPEYVEYDDVTVRTQSLPSSGGLTIGQILELVEPFDLCREGRQSSSTYEVLLEAFSHAYADRGAYMGDKAFVDAPWQGLFDEAYLETRRAGIAPDGSANGSPGPGNPWDYQPGEPYRVEPLGRAELGGGPEKDTGQTTHFTTADSEGNMVSWTSTIEQFFGSGLMVPDYGFMLNNELTDFDAVPGGPNEVQPWKRPLSSTSPTIVFRDGNPYMTVGSPGGKTIITTVAQVILNVVEFGMSLPEAIAAPRVYKDTDPEIIWEQGVPEAVRTELTDAGFEFAEEPAQLGNVQAILVDPESGEYLGAADARRDGSVVGI